MIDARNDVWGDAARGQPDGPSYGFFKDLLSPLRWVNAEFRYYPIVLSAPRAAEKTRLVTNGSAVNAKANKLPMWFEQGVPVKFSKKQGAAQEPKSQTTDDGLNSFIFGTADIATAGCLIRGDQDA